MGYNSNNEVFRRDVGSNPVEHPKLDAIRRKRAEGALDELQRVFTDLEAYDRRIANLHLALEDTRQGVSKECRALQLTLEHISQAAEGLEDTGLVQLARLSKGQFGQLEESLKGARDLASKLIALQTKAYSLRETIARFRRTGKGRLNRTSDERTSPPWEALKGLEHLWNEALDLLSGFCLRHVGLDKGLCQFADQIVKEIGWSGASPITVPGRGGPGVIAHIIHLRFPEWTIWALPLTPFELWFLGERNLDDDNVRTDPFHELKLSICEYSEDEASALDEHAIVWHDETFQKCLADGFGLYTMGPAYACASMLLLFDPLSPQCDLRARMMLATLAETPEYRDNIVIQLTRQWCEATSATGLQQMIPAGYEPWLRAYLHYLDRSPILPFQVERWRSVRTKLVEAVRQDPLPRIDDIDNIEIRYVLNAAWKARCEIEAARGNLAAVENSTLELLGRLAKSNRPDGDNWFM